MPHRILVIANSACPCPALEATLRRRRVDPESCDVLIVVPALNTRVAHWVSDTDGAMRRAAERLQDLVGRVTALGFAVDGRVGDGDPAVAVDDALREFGADEIVIATLPAGRSHWLERRLLRRVAERHPQALEHVAGDHDLDPIAA